ncbi:hypothetical protein [Streptomyces sp. NPDC021212]|uniref:hypothetical protein n=1 Tax=Streptomyces sp. NPDC021212 TaxID=3365118 RepID=UPI003793720B
MSAVSEGCAMVVSTELSKDTTENQVTAWLDALHGAGPRDPRHFRLNAEYDAVWYADDHAFVPAHSTRHGRMSVVHSWIFNGATQGYGAMSHASVHHAAYLVELSRAFAVTPPARCGSRSRRAAQPPHRGPGVRLP